MEIPFPTIYKTSADAKCSPRSNKDSLEFEDDKWKTYKDYLKRKRDYKREWRKRKYPAEKKPKGPRHHGLSPSKAPEKAFPIFVNPTSPAIDFSIDEECPTEHTIEEEEASAYAEEEQNVEALALAEEEHVHQIEEEGAVFLETEIHEQVDDNDEYFCRRELVFGKLESLPTEKRLRILSIIEGFVDEAW